MEQSFDRLRALVSEHPDDPLLLWVMGIQCRDYFVRFCRTTHSEEGAAAYQRLAQLLPQGPVMLHQTYANILAEELKRYADALPHRETAVRLAPTSWAYEGLGNTLSQLKRYEEAYAAFAAANALAPRNAHVLSSWGRALAAAGRLDAAADKYRESSERNPANPAVWYSWGLCLYKQGQYAACIPLLAAASQGGDSAAIALLGELSEFGRGTATNIPAAIAFYERAAAAGNGWAMNQLGNMYDSGHGVVRNGETALRWYLRGADAGNTSAAANVGTMYFHRRDVPRDEQWQERAFAYSLTAAQADPPSHDAMRQVVHCYLTGAGVARDIKLATEWSIKAAGNGVTSCMALAGNAYDKGTYVPRDLGKALKAYKAAIQSGDTWYGPKFAAARIMATAPDSQLWDGPAAAALAADAVKAAGPFHWAEFDAAAAAYARNGQFAEAVALEQRALADMAELRAQQNHLLVPRLDKWRPLFEARLKLYESGMPYTDPPYDPAAGGFHPNPLSDRFWRDDK